MTQKDFKKEITEFNHFLGDLPHEHKVKFDLLSFLFLDFCCWKS